MSLTELTPTSLRAWPLPTVQTETDKESRGRVLVAGGATPVAGAVLLAAVAALRAGAGKLQVAAPASFATHLALSLPEARVFGLPETPEGELAPEAADPLEAAVDRADAVVIGPGLLDSEAAGELALRLMQPDGPPMVVDAAAMPRLAQEPGRARRHGGRLVLTPHAGEMAGLLGRDRADVEADPLDAARTLAADLHAVVALKGAQTFIVSPDGRAWRNVGGCPGLATSGSGDVLSGVIGGLLARGAPPAQAAAWGSYVHGAAGRRLAARIAPVGFLARELLDEIAPALGELDAPA
ncbi:NAD(P)H-hydrate dehydratase [Phenylobacterium sp. J426]|uniref:NAD(P)H-hydrate dehydratase n=1 Tax=Phenylobacterium sp. J426 TaxID=2898439 RepID=UPI002151B805|nr:NAD(P)H-hydrate dehydratase [Phenylobacterium sp. J426]MCR5875307.1 NAD(P)H-hydrate dehydratase [Phenylobacterium sp. J426]